LGGHMVFESPLPADLQDLRNSICGLTWANSCPI
jgi:hypothetical protein